MKKKLLTLSMCLAVWSGLSAQTNPVYYNAGKVTDLSQLKNGDYIVIQNVRTDQVNRQGFINLDEEENNLSLVRTGAYNREVFRTINASKIIDAGKIFEVRITDDGAYTFKNIGNDKYILNNTSSGATLQATPEDANNTFVIEENGAAWKIKSKANNLYWDSESNNRPILYAGSCVHEIYLVSTDKPVSPSYYLAVYGVTAEPNGRQGNCIEYVQEKEEGIYAGNKIQTDNINQIWKIEESETDANRFAITDVTGGHSISMVSRSNSSNARYRYGEGQSFQFTISEAPVYSGYTALRFKRYDATNNFMINAAGGGQRYYLNEWNTTDQSGSYDANAWSPVVATRLNATENGYALGTFSAPYNVTLPDGVTAYIATNKDNSTILLEELTLPNSILPAHTPVILRAAAAGYYPMVQTAAEAGEVHADDNLLQGNGADLIVTPVAGIYSLGKIGDQTAMYSYTASSIAPFKAYLPKSNVAREQIQAKSIVFPGEGTTGIESTESGQSHDPNAPIYNLNGQKVSKPVKGVYIQGGKKFIVR